MKQALSYNLKAWLTTMGIAYVAMLTMVFYGLSKPNHSKELDPFFATVGFFFLNLLFLPAWAIFIFCVKPITNRVIVKWKQKVLLSLVASILVACTIAPLLFFTYPDGTYYGIGGSYLTCMIISIWIHRLTV
jgi:hypothetical protein